MMNLLSGSGDCSSVCVVAAMEPCVPPGFRFHPTDEELVGYYLKKKVAAQKIDMDIIREIDLRRIEPWKLQDSCRVGFEEQNEWYFFSHPEKKHTSGTRTNRATKTGFWKATGRDKAVYEKNRIIGKRKTLVFYKGRAPNGQKTEWIVHEYRLDSDVNELPTEEAWVVCRAFKKGANSQTRYTESSVSRYFLDEPAGVSSIKYITVQPQNLIFKQEREACRSLHILNSDNFIQLPLLESPTLPPVKRQSLMSLVPENIEDEHHKGCHNVQKGIEWRTLDKFVASQLCQEQ